MSYKMAVQSFCSILCSWPVCSGRPTCQPWIVCIRSHRRSSSKGSRSSESVSTSHHCTRLQGSGSDILTSRGVVGGIRGYTTYTHLFFSTTHHWSHLEQLNKSLHSGICKCQSNSSRSCWIRCAGIASSIRSDIQFNAIFSDANEMVDVHDLDPVVVPRMRRSPQR